MIFFVFKIKTGWQLLYISFLIIRHLLSVELDLVLHKGVAVVENSKEIFSWSVDCFSKKIIGEKKLIGLVVKFVVPISSGKFVSFFGSFLQLTSTQASKFLIKVLQRGLADAVSSLSCQNHIVKHLGKKLNPDWEIFHSCRATAKPCPHVQPVLEADARDGYLAGFESLIPRNVLISLMPVSFSLHLLKHTFQESSIVIYEAEVSWVIFFPSSNNSKKFIEVVDVVFINEARSALIQLLKRKLNFSIWKGDKNSLMSELSMESSVNLRTEKFFLANEALISEICVQSK